nr:hypothetical protein [Bacteroidia bacterium]
MKKFKLFLFIGSLFCLHTDSRAGVHLNTDSIDCVSKKKQYSDLILSGNFKEAFPIWRNVFAACQGHSKSIYSDGIQLYEKKIVEEKNPVIKSALTDTLLMIYDQRIQYFGEEGMVSGLKGIAMYQFAPQKKNEINLLLKKSVQLEGSKSKAEVLEIFFDVNKELYLDKKITRENLIDVFHNLSLLTDTNRFHPNSAKYNKTQRKMDAYISTIVNCNELVEMYSKDVKSNPDDVNQLRKIVHLF